MVSPSQAKLSLLHAVKALLNLFERSLGSGAKLSEFLAEFAQ
jgi:hypothetical protein